MDKKQLISANDYEGPWENTADTYNGLDKYPILEYEADEDENGKSSSLSIEDLAKLQNINKLDGEISKTEAASIFWKLFGFSREPGLNSKETKELEDTSDYLYTSDTLDEVQNDSDEKKPEKRKYYTNTGRDFYDCKEKEDRRSHRHRLAFKRPEKRVTSNRRNRLSFKKRCLRCDSHGKI